MDVLATLKTEEMRLKSDLAKVQKAIAALNGAGSYGSNSAVAKPIVRPERKLSAAGRARIVAALKARRAKVKAAKKKTK